MNHEQRSGAAAHGGLSISSLDRVLVATSFSEPATDAVRKAALLAAKRHATLTLLHVVEPVKRRHLRKLSGHHLLLAARLTHARKELARLAGEIAATQGVPVEIRVEVGERLASILAACHDADVLFVGGTQMGWLAGTFHRSMAERLLGRCSIPMLVVNGRHCLQHRRVLVPFDGSPRSLASVRAAAWLWPDARVTVVHAIDRPPDRLMRIARFAPDALHERRRRRSADVHRSIQSMIAGADLHHHDLSCRVDYGDVPGAVLSAHGDIAADAMVLTKRRPSTIAQFVLGGTTRRLLSTVACDVLITPADSSPSMAAIAPSSRKKSGHATLLPRLPRVTPQ